MAALQNGTVVAGYRIDGVLGEGGMGTVYRATQLSLNRVIALKLLTEEFSADAEFRARFRREGLLQAALDHPHIVTVYEAGETEYGLFLAMRLVEGPTLKSVIGAAQLDDRRALRLLTQVAEALDAAHQQGLIHRDVKPQNILIGARDHAYLADFGLTKAPDDSGVTEEGSFLGTIDYVSPEQARGQRATARSDVYELAGVLFECLTGRPPYQRPTEDRVLLAHLTDPPPRPSELRPDLPTALDEVIARGMAKQEAERPESAGELMLEARRAFGTAPVRDSPAPTSGTTARSYVAESGATRQAATVDPAPPAATSPPGQAQAPPRDGLTRPSPAEASASGDVTRPSPAETQPPRAGHGSGAAVMREPGAAAPVSGTRRRGGPRAPALLAGLALAGAAAGFLLGGGAKRTAGSFLNSASAGPIELAYPSSWQRLTTVPAIPALALSQPLALAPQNALGGQALVAGTVSAGGPALLPSSLTGALARPLPPPEPVLLGSLQAYRYSRISLRSLSNPLTVYVVPTTSGVATVACLLSTGSATSPANQCAEIASTLRLAGARAFSLAPSPQYASALARALAALRSTRSVAESQLNGARTAAAQAGAADRLSTAYHGAAQALSQLVVSPAARDANAQLVGALQALAGDYGAAAAATRKGDSRSYAGASRAILRDAAALTRALTALRQAGYAVSV